MGARRWCGALATAVALVGAGAACEPGGGAWARTADMHQARTGHTATVLSSTGRVLVTGGVGTAGALRSVERWDPSTGAWTPLAPMGAARSNHTATELPDGRVLVAGGASSASAEIYSRSADTWTPTRPMNVRRSGHDAVRLTNGRVLVVGGGTGTRGGGAEYYDPASGHWVQTGQLPSFAEDPDGPGGEYRVTAVSFDGVIALPGGGALALVGWETLHLPDCPGACSSSSASSALFQYSSSSNGWSRRPSVVEARWGPTSTLLQTGRVLAAGGLYGGMFGQDCATGEADVYDPGTGAWSDRGGLNDDRWQHAATLLADGRVLVTGGMDPPCESQEVVLSSAELYVPAERGFGPAAPMAAPRYGHRAVLLGDGRVLVVGGAGPDHRSLVRADVYTPS